ncbi:ADP-ribosylglycohydrolase family protein [Pedobacter nyackensis]|uniref:ADP-ribosylglycohydrolase n=1 Tax=Pedobacter nyackensis TaxID=475255 RepID=A0A1W2ER82_9SPHI|nr:ADP-ribosylglycohydrolase family protein [Pedobacter nyackensis]SMD12237.1 ADP-ribosylglycohydrolase [Pedobacter nyackensis]
MKNFWTMVLLMSVIGIGSTTRILAQKIISKSTLKDKIKGGWAGQTIGVTFGWPSEFQYQGTFIQDYETIKWHDDYVNEAMTSFPGLFDDVYVDLTFVEVFDRLGLDAPADSFAKAFAASQYQLWHANQAGRYNIQQGIPAVKSGHWLNNPHADDIDFQIESDFIGLMSPGMPNTASDISDKVGHIMNSGDGWYGGVFISNMYALAFINNDISYIVNTALKAIPVQSKFYQCIADVVKWHKLYPTDWKRTWFEVQKKWAEDVGCPSMVFHPLNIDAKINAAYVVIGLLYGQGDFTKTLEISTRAGQDSDCNPSSAAGILGVILGYDKIPQKWITPLKKAEHRDFSFTKVSLNKVYEMGYNHALKNILKNGGSVRDDQVIITISAPKTVRFEENFAGHFPVGRISLAKTFQDKLEFNMNGIGFVIRGYAHKKKANAAAHVLQGALFIDGREVERANFPTGANQARTDLFWRYQLAKGDHKVKIEILNPHPDYEFVTVDYLVYDSKPLRLPGEL